MAKDVQFPDEVNAEWYTLLRIPGTNDYEVMFADKHLGTVRVIPRYGRAAYFGPGTTSTECSKMHRIVLQMLMFTEYDFTPRLGEIKDLIWEYTIS